MVTFGHSLVDMQVTIELATSPAVTVHVTVLLLVIFVTPLFSNDSETSMVPHTAETEHVYATNSLTVAEDVLTTHSGDEATERQ